MLRNPIRSVAIVCCAAVLTASSLWAHHGWSAYHEDKPLNVQGTITQSSYVNPHGSMKLRVVTGDQEKIWDVVLAPVSRMQSRGLTEAMLKPGTTATVVGYQHREIATEMRAENVTIDGKKVELR